MKYERMTPENFKIKDYDTVDYVMMGRNTSEICYRSRRNAKPTVAKIDQENYLVRSTGEIKNYQKKAGSRVQSPESLRKTFRKITQLINTNVTDVNKVKFITLTYAENMKNPQKLYEDFRRFNQRFTRYCIRDNLGSPEYIAIAEPQGRGAWHLHVFYIFPYPVRYIPYQVIYALWQRGSIDIKKLDNTDNIAGYMNAYFSNMEIPETAARQLDDTDVYTATVNHQKKYFRKGARLPYYPAGFNILRHSRGIKQPQKIVTSYKCALEMITARGQTLKYASCCKLIGEEEFELIVKREEYRK